MNSLCQMGEKKNRDKLVARFFLYNFNIANGIENY